LYEIEFGDVLSDEVLFDAYPFGPKPFFLWIVIYLFLFLLFHEIINSLIIFHSLSQYVYVFGL
jgi:hypothetical protein